MYKLSLFIFRRDLRLEDNTGLLAALQSSQSVVPCFIFDPRQLKDNPYRSDNALQFMIDSLEELDEVLRLKGSRLYFFYGEPHEIIARLLAREKIDAVFANRDYTPFAIHRDLSIRFTCEKAGRGFNEFGDSLLTEPETVKKGNGGVYTVFTPFYRKAARVPVPTPQKNTYSNFYSHPVTGVLPDPFTKIELSRNPHLGEVPGRKAALAILKRISSFRNYEAEREVPAIEGTTRLSAHLKFGTVSPREVWSAIAKGLGRSHPLMRELYWRDFFTHVGFHFPHVLGGAFDERYSDIPWKDSDAAFQRWCHGLTGFPIVDAGMRELNQTGFMHNRVRMVTASFLVKDLQIDWQKGERYFAQRLVDYDPLVNNGNWQWVASTGCEAQPYSRIFNPWLQQVKFDPACRYIKQWIPELKDAPASQIHGLGKSSTAISPAYPLPMLDHKKVALETKKLYS